MDDNCLVCGNTLGTVDVVTISRGRDTLIQASLARKDGLALHMENASPLRVHSVCRKNYTRPSSIKAYASSSSAEHASQPQDAETPLLRSSLPTTFDFKRDCLFCGEEACMKAQRKQPTRYKKLISEVRSVPEFQNSVRCRALERNDEWGTTILGRVDGAIDLVAAEAKYHRGCHLEFYSSVQTDQARGRPEDSIKHKAFEELCAYLNDNDECQYSISELHNIMSQFLDEQPGYTTKHMKAKLMDHYGDKVTITEIPGKHGVVSFRDTVHNIIHDKWYTDKCADMKQERKRIVETAASIVREDIRSCVYECDEYPEVKPLEELEEDIVPQSLHNLINGIINPRGKPVGSINRKCHSIKQSIIAATRPRSFLSPLLISIAVYLHRKYGSRDLIDLLNSLGVCASYREVQRYEYSLIVNGSPPPEPGGFVQFIFDNADFNVNTLDGHNTFHSMGGIKCHTPALVSNCSSPVARQMNPPKATVIGSFGKVQIKTYINPTVPGLQRILVKDIMRDVRPELNSLLTAGMLDSLWIAGCALEISPRPSWNGFMQVIMQHTGTYEVSHLQPLPFINMDPTNLSTIYTALRFAQGECKKQGVHTCFVTFDQPLFLKASEIVAASDELDNIVVRLGGFHLLMSYMGAVGNIMRGSGLEELWSTVYAKASVAHMTTGHAYSRALRAHYLTQLAVATILLRTPDCLSEDDKDTLTKLYQDLLNEETSTEDALKTNVISQLKQILEQLSDHAKAISRTAKLWIQYFEQVNIMRLFVRAERTGDWELHLYTVTQMLPHLHAAGHLPYAKSAHLYVQQMTDLSEKMTSEEYNMFTKRGFFTIRRSDKFWCGVWSDMTIEQVLMRAIKTSGGLTRGRGISESTLAQWVLALPLCVPLCNALETFTGVNPGTSEQHKEHKELLPSRQTRDNHDLNSFLEWLEAHPPFANKPDNTLVSLATGIVANETINCDEAERHGSKAMQEMVGKPFAGIKLRRNDKVKPLAAMTNTVKIRNDEVIVNPLQLFSRIACIINSSSELSSFLKYELAPRPPSLFDDVSMRKATKATLATLLESLAPGDNNIPDGALFVVDGGHLLHSVIWPRPATYDEICQMYLRYVIKHYHSKATIVFDGYDGPPSTKSVEQNRRASKAVSADIMFTGSMHTTTTQAGFLGNGRNKSRLIQAMSSTLLDAGIHVAQATADADTMIVSTALDLASNGETVVLVGTDTDLLVILVARAPTNAKLFMLRPSINNKPAKLFNITAIQQAVGEKQKNLLFLHAITGCDTTSALYGQGKKKAFRLLMSNNELAMEMTVFNMETSSPADVSEAGEKFLLALYGGTRFNKLDEYRYYAYKRNIAGKSVGAKFTLATLPPTSAAARQHSLRTYLQVQQWLGKDPSPTEWGWKTHNNLLLPVPTDMPPAPQKLMKLISCNCKAGCMSRCGCRQAGMACSAMCSQCMGIGCSNAPQAEELDTDEDE